MSKYMSCIYVVVDAESEAEACDAMTGAMSETLKYGGAIVDWAYVKQAGRYDTPAPLPATAPADIEDEDFEALYESREVEPDVDAIIADGERGVDQILDERERTGL